MDAGDASSADMTRPPADHVGAGPPTLDEVAVERLLDGDLDPASAPSGYADVAALLAAATAEPSPDELAGQAAALAELRTLVRAPPAAGNRPAGRRRRGVLLAVAVVVGALSTGGVAAGTGHVPQAVREAARSILTVVGAATPGTPGEPGRQPASSRAATGRSGTPAAGPGQDRPGPTAATGAAVAATDGRCRAFLAGKGKKEPDRGAVEALAAAAGGRDRIAAYCLTRQPGGVNGNGRGTPPTTAANQGPGHGGPPPGTGGGGKPGKDDPPKPRHRGR